MDELESMKQELEEYRRREAERAEAEAKRAMDARVEAALDGRSFLHPRLRELVTQDFARARAEAPEKSDAEIFRELTEGQNYFACEHPPMPEPLAVGAVQHAEQGLRSMRAALGLREE
ncbi:MAG: hypothetical protein IJ074_01230 [Clostridia bacterium]|nr:hypothetical protein [Clostridia bacterium]